MTGKYFESSTKKERKKLAKSWKEKEETTTKLKDYLTKSIIFIIVVFVIGGLVFVFTRKPAPKPQIGQVLSEQSRDHIAQGSKQHPPYSSNPPTSGSHWPQPAKCQIYIDEIADEAAIHSLEHGAVWVSYKNKNDKNIVAKLADLVKGNSNKVLLSPRSKNDSAIAVVSWNRLLKLDDFDSRKITDLINNYKNNSPEPFASC